MRSLRVRQVTAIAFLCMASTVLGAQSARPDTAQGSIRDLILIDPILIPFNIYNGEYEHVLSRSATLGLSGTYYGDYGVNGDNGFGYYTAEVKGRYYPQEHAPDGFSLAGTVGVTRVSGGFFDYSNGYRRSASTYPTIGVELDYNWLLGPTRRFAIGTGIGAKRLLGSHNNGTSGGLPTARVAVGVAF